LPYIDGFTFRVIPDDSVALTEMQTGQLDIYESGIQAQNIPIAKADPKMAYFEFGWTGTIRPTIGFNQRKGPFTDLRLRQAALYALDRQAQANAFGAEVARPHFSPYWYSYFLGWDESLPHYTYDPEKAKELVRQVNPGGVDVQLSQIAREPDNSMSVVLKAMWDKVGLNTTITAMERLAWIDRQRKDDFQVAFWGHALPALDPDALSAVFIKGAATNWNNWESPTMEALLKRGREESDPAKRSEIYKQAQRTIYDDAAFGCSFLVPSNLTHRASVKGYGIEITAGYYNEVWLDR
jgi:ABC-type transport system substrate-binding protein